jgi:hypothetical protein
MRRRDRGQYLGPTMRGRSLLILRAMVMLLLIAVWNDVGTAADAPAEMVLIPAGSLSTWSQSVWGPRYSWHRLAMGGGLV